jgi:hypothetical protein
MTRSSNSPVSSRAFPLQATYSNSDEIGSPDGTLVGMKSIDLLQNVPQINLPLLPADQSYGKPGLTFRKYEGMPHSLAAEVSTERLAEIYTGALPISWTSICHIKEIDDLSEWLQGITFDVWTASHRKGLSAGESSGTGSTMGHQTFPSANQVMSYQSPS